MPSCFHLLQFALDSAFAYTCKAYELIQIKSISLFSIKQPQYLLLCFGEKRFAYSGIHIDTSYFGLNMGIMSPFLGLFNHSSSIAIALKPNYLLYHNIWPLQNSADEMVKQHGILLLELGTQGHGVVFFVFH